MKYAILLLIAVCGVCSEISTNGYEGYKVYRLKPTTQDQNELLLRLTQMDDLDFWRQPNKAGLPVDVMVKPDDQHAFEKVLLKVGLKPEVMIKDVKSVIDSQRAVDANHTIDMTWDKYFKLDDIHIWMDEVARTHFGKVYLSGAGFSYEGRPLKGMRILNRGKKIIVIDGGIHGREWISTATVTGLMEVILNNTYPDFQRVARSFEWFLFPSINPDSYHYTHQDPDNRLWHKTRTNYGDCFGADLNKNWDIDWMGHGSSNVSCLDSYAGPKPKSEMETFSMEAFYDVMHPDIAVYLSLRAYSQSVMIPYGYTDEHLDNYIEMMEIGKKTVEGLKKRYGTDYQLGTFADFHNLQSGGMLDYMKRKYQIPVVAAIEMRDLGEHGFLLPPEQILPSIEEICDGIIALVEEAEKYGYVELVDPTDENEYDDYEWNEFS